METVHRVSIQWIPEDDLLLRNAVEDGASLEALAKGAVEFSRRYTLQELKERWHSLLYDDDISSQASYHMFQLEKNGVTSASKYRPESNCGRNKDIGKIRRSDSIRKKYYAMRKRLRTEFYSEHTADFQEQVMPDGYFLKEEMLDILRNAFPGNVLGAPVEYGAANVVDHVNPALFEEDYQKRVMAVAGFNKNLATSSGEERADNHAVTLEVSPSVRNDPVGGNIRNTIDGLVARQKFHLPNYDCLDTVLACNEAQVQPWTEMQNVNSPALPASMGLPISPEAGENIADANVVNITNEAVNLGEISGSDSLIHLPNEDASFLVNFDGKPVTEDRCCTLNFDRIHRDSVNGTVELNPDAFQINTFPEASFEVTNRTEILTQKCSGSAICGDMNIHSILDLPSKLDFIVLNDEKVCCVLNTEDCEIPCNDDIFLFIHPTSSPFPSETQLDAVIPPFTNTCSPDKRKPEPAFNLLGKETRRSSALLYRTPKFAENGVHSAAVPAKELHPEFADVSPMSDDENSQWNFDVPYFSDVESMILEMDLSPYDEDSHIIRKDPSYQYDETKRTIIRLEQGARSCLQRAMTSQGAFAIFYGRYLRHYIRKTEVLLGRSTDDIAADIDLAIEGIANKISRRQAIIKMDANGSFFMKNLGRSSILLNGTTVLSGQVVNLCSGCLIEVKGMSFMFEINHGYVKKHLGNLCLNRRKEDPC